MVEKGVSFTTLSLTPNPSGPLGREGPIVLEDDEVLLVCTVMASMQEIPKSNDKVYKVQLNHL